MKLRFLALALFMSLAVVACKDTTTTNDEDVETVEDQTTNTFDQMKSAQPPMDSVHTAEIALDIAGTYKGTVPCADCEGVETTVMLDDHKTARVQLNYIGKDAKVEERGTWTIDGNTLTLNRVANVPNKFKVEENRLVQLDKSGNEITGDLADKYILKKQ